MLPDPRLIRIDDFDYHLPPDRIAQFPPAKRGDSKLLFFDRGHIRTEIFSNLPSIVGSGFHFVMNDTRVVHARLIFQKPTGGVVEIFCLEPFAMDMEQGLLQKGTACWQCMVGGAKKWKRGGLRLEHNGVWLEANLEQRSAEVFIVRFTWQPEKLSFAGVLETFGKIPLPPYMQRPAVEVDSVRYQTTFAKNEGSVAAPTAGLHFTPTIIEKLRSAGNTVSYLTLHVGAGTFKPVSTQFIGDHEMHSEFFCVEKNFIEQLLNTAKRLVAVGTTSLRTVESIYWIGVKILAGKIRSSEDIRIAQWEVYEIAENDVTMNQSLDAILAFLEDSGASSLRAHTSIIIVPGYRFRMVHGLVTNFHLPKSTLLLLVAALAGPGWKQIYDYALADNFRFLSYGDASLIIP